MVGEPQEFLRTGLPNFRAGVEAAHPLEAVAVNHERESKENKLKMLQNVYGSAFPLKQQIEEAIVGSSGRLPGLPSSRLGLDALTGRLDRFTEADYLADPAESELTPPPMHAVMEQRLGLGTKPHTR